ncbi:MAG: polysaccharide export protein [Bacteroidales bacterium]|nr:polysaccharide export protein [Candidatus Sodaliphilus aphodohippi]
MMASCTTPRVGLFQNAESGSSFKIQSPQFVLLQPGDKLSILVSSKDPQLAYLFNLPIVGHYRTTSSEQGLNINQVASYTVDQNGCIDFPVVGEMKLAGMTKKEISQYIKNTLINKGYLKDPQVTVDFLDLTFGVIGEVKNPGRFAFDHDKITLLDAISRAGDLTIYGIRENVLVTREENGEQKFYRINMTNVEEIYSSPVYYLKPNDIIYVEPNDKKAKESTIVGATYNSPSFWLSVASVLTSMSVLIFK